VLTTTTTTEAKGTRANSSVHECTFALVCPKCVNDRIDALTARVYTLERMLESLIADRATSEEKGRKLIAAAKSGNPLEIMKLLGGL
jgi:hypothetical protein